MATNPKSKKFASLSDREKARRIQAGETSGRMSRAEADKARRFWGVATAPPRTPSPAARIFGAEQQLAPWELRPPKVPPRSVVLPSRPPPRAPTAQEQRANTRLRLEAAKRSVLEPKARQVLAATLTPQRREQLQRADVLPPKRADRGFTGLAPTPEERKKLTDRGFNPLTPLSGVADYLTRQALNEVQAMGEDLGPLVQGAYEWTFSPEERADNAALLRGATENSARWSKSTSDAIDKVLARESDHLEQAGIPVPESLKNTVKASVKTSVESLVGIAPGSVAMAAHPIRAGEQMAAQYKDYYGRLAQGDFSVLEEQGITQPLMDALGLAGAAFGGAARVGALSRTNQFLREGGELALSSDGRPISAAAARQRALGLKQEPVQLPDGTTTMGVPTPIREVMREATVRKGTPIEEGNRVVARDRNGEGRIIVASEENGLAGHPAPDVNDPIRVKVEGESVEIVAAYTDVPFAQRMIPRSEVGQRISDLYWRFRAGTGTGEREALDLRGSGKGVRARLLRQEREVAEDRTRGAISAFRQDHREIQNDVVLATAYDRLLRYPDPVAGIEQEIAARRQRGGVDETSKQGQKFMAALEQALEVVKDPPEKLMRAAWAGKMLADDTTQFLINRGMLSPETAERAEFAAQRWLKPGHLRDEPLDSPRRREVEEAIREQYGEEADLAMAHTDTLARAWGEATGNDPADWYETFIRGVERQPAGQIERTAAANPQALRQYRRTPAIGETLALRDPETGDMRVARVHEIVGEVATVEWVREPNAGVRFKVPKEEVMGNTTKIHGWYSGIAIEAEKLGEKVSKQEAHSRLSKAPGVKKDEWQWMGMERILDDLYPPGTKSRSRDEIVAAIRANTFRFETTKLDANEAYFESQYDVTMPGPYVDYEETLIHWPERIEPLGEDTPMEPDWYDIQESWGEHVKELKQEALARGEEWDDDDYLTEAPQWYIDAEVENYQEAYAPPEPLYEAPHFTDDQNPDRYNHEESPGLNQNLLGWLRTTTRGVAGKLTRVIEEAQSDWHQKSGGRYRTEEAVAAHKEAQRVAEDAHAKYSAKKRIYQSAFREAVDKGDVPVRIITTGEEGIVKQGEWGGVPYYQVIAPVDKVQEGYAEQAVIGARNHRDELAGKLREAERGWGTLADEPDVVQLRAEVEQATATLREIEAQQRGYYHLDRTTDTNLEPVEDHDLMDKFSEMREAEGQYQDKDYIARQRSIDARAHPDAPYKGSAWEEMLFREAVRQAVADGQTQIAWTTGAQQAQRYNELFASRVNRVEWNGHDLRVRDADGGSHTFEANTETKLVEYVGSAMAKKLAEQLAANTAEVDPNLVRIDRPTGGGHTQTHFNQSLSDVEAGDVVYVGYPDPDHFDTVHQLFVRKDDAGHTTLFEWDPEGKFPVTGHGEHMNIMEAKEHILGYQQDQLDLGLRPRFGEDRAAVLEGEDISIGGGGFIDAYDRRMRNYARKYLGADPRQVPVDDFNYDVIHISDPRHPQHEDYFNSFDRMINDPLTDDQALATEMLEELAGSYAPVYRVKLGDTIFAESESLQLATRAAKLGGFDAGIWPVRIRKGERGYWHIVDRGGVRGGTAPTYETVRSDGPFPTLEAAIEKAEQYAHSDWDDTFDHEGRGTTGKSRDNPGPVWLVEIPEGFAAQLHERGTQLFQRRRGQVYGLAHITDEGADIYLNADDADIATWIEESAHAVIPDWFDQADVREDRRADHIREYVELGPGEPIDNLANERIVRAFQAWLRRGAMGAPQQRELLHGLSEELKDAYYNQGAISPSDSGAAEIKRMLNDPVVTSFFRDQFDVAPYKDLDPGTVAFSTMKTRTKVKRTTGERVQTSVRSILPSRRNLAKARNTMRAWESGQFDVGPDVTAHYAAAEARLRSQDELARRLKRYDEPIEIVDGMPQLKPGYRVYNYHGIRGANSRLDRMFRASDRYGDISTKDSEEPLISADPAAGGIDVDAIDFLELVEETAAGVLAEEMLYDSIADAAAKVGDTFLEKVQKGHITQIPEDAAHAFESASGASFSLGAVSNMSRALAAVLAIPAMKARWLMIGKFAYPLLNTGATALLLGINQGPALAFSVKSTLDLTRGTRFRLMMETGYGVADVATHTPELYGLMERARRVEQEAFRKSITFLSGPEARLRVTQIVNDLARAGYRSEKDIVALLDKAKSGDTRSTQILNQIGRHAEDAVVRFRGLSPEEQFVVRDALFVYGWLRAATRFTLQFPLNRPVTSAAMFNVGQMGWQQIQDDFWPLTREQAGALPLGQRKTADGFARKIVDLNQLLPFSTATQVLAPIMQMMGLEDGGLRGAAIADFLSPSVQFALTGVFGKDPRYGTSIWDAIKDEVDPRNLPGATWGWRLINPADSGTKLREPRDRLGVISNLFLGMMAPQEIRESVSFERWLDQQPQAVRTVIREQNNATTFAQLAQAAAQVNGEENDAESLRAINADTAYKVYADLYKHKHETISPLERSAIKAEVLKHYYPDAYGDGAADIEGVDFNTPEGSAEYQAVWDDLYEETVTSVNKATRAYIKETLDRDVPESDKQPHTLDDLAGNWIATAPADSLQRVESTIKQRGIENDHDRVREVILNEMQRASVP